MEKEKEIILLIESFEYLKETIKAIQMVAASDLKKLKICLYVVFFIKESEENLEGLRVYCCRRKVDISVNQRRNYSTNYSRRSKRFYVKLHNNIVVPKRTAPMELEEAKRYLSELKAKYNLASVAQVLNAFNSDKSITSHPLYQILKLSTVCKSKVVELRNTPFNYFYDDSDIFLPEPYYYNKNSFEPIYRLLTSKECSKKKLYREKKKDENWYHRNYWLWSHLGEVYYFLVHLSSILKIEKSEFGGYPDFTDTKVLVLSGPRNSGKSLLINGILNFLNFWCNDVYQLFEVVESKENNIEEFKKKIEDLEKEGGENTRYIYIVESEEDLRNYYDKNEFNSYYGLGAKGEHVYFYHIVGTLEEKGLSKKEIEEGLPFLFFLLSNTNVEDGSRFWELLIDIWEYSCNDSMRLNEEERVKYYYDEYEEILLESENRKRK